MKRIFIFLLLFILSGCTTYDEYEIPEEAFININNISINVYDEVNLYSLIGDNNVEILTDDFNLNTDEIGTFTETIKYKYNNREYKYDIDYTVDDTTPPVYISASSVKTVLINDDVYPCDNIVFGDNYDRSPTCKIDGYYDTTTVGKYSVEYVIKDSSLNETRKNLTINVVDAISSGSSSTTKKSTLSITNVINDKKNENTMIGIDVSRWQETIDFNKVKESGVEFVIMRMGINSDIDKDISVDSYYYENIKNAKAAGLKVGIYVYSSAINTETAIEHAKWTLEILNGETLDFPIAFDWENWSKFRSYGISIHDLNETYYAFEKVLNEGGYQVSLYSSKFYLENIWDKDIDNVWLAHYTNETTYEGDYYMWQMSNVGRVDGINGNVDIDILYLDKYNKIEKMD